MKTKISQYIAIILTIIAIAGGYFYFQSKASQKINSSKVNNLTSGLVGYWTFDGADMNATQALDMSVNDNHGTLSGTSRVAGKTGQGLNFNGTSDYVNVPDTTGSALDITGSISLSVWYKYGGKTGDWRRIVSKIVASGNPWDLYNLELDSGVEGNQKPFFLISTGVSGSATAIYSTVPLQVGEWYHITGTYDAATGARSITVNGTRTSNSITPITIGTNDESFRIGTRSGDYIKGIVDEVRVYNRVITQSEINELYQQGQTKINASQAGKLTNGLVGYWTMDGADTAWTSSTAGTVADKSPVGTNTGTLTNMSQSADPKIGKIGQGLYFDGTDNLIDMGDNIEFDINDPFSFSFWVKFENFSGHLISKWYGGCTAGWYISADSSKVSFAMNGYNCGWKIVDEATTSSLNVWYHYAVTYNGSGSANGVKIYKNTAEGQNIVINQSIDTILNNLSFRIGARSHPGDPSFFNKGVLDEVRVYNRAITQSEITELYQQGQAKINASQTGKLTNNLVVYQSFDGNHMDWSQATAEARDQSGNNNHGDVTNMTNAKAAIGKVGQALNFDGSGDYVNMGDVNAVDGQSYLTLSAWVNLNSLTSYDGIFVKSTGATRFLMEHDPDCDATNYRIGVDINWQGGYTSSMTLTNANDVGKWHLWTMVFDGTQTGNANRLKFYYDGVQQTLGFGTIGPNCLGSITVPSTTSNTSDNLLIGYTGGVSPNAKIDEARVYNRALSQSEVTELYNMGR